ncbi:acyltransferase [Pseudoalteromonas sp. XMcav11-Q]|uniref:acyltransferase n=1 Tax=Pseudoalteromonas sp. XMcav11-Q TaxID=3136665 RepID=UPI0032C46369
MVDYLAFVLTSFLDWNKRRAIYYKLRLMKAHIGRGVSLGSQCIFNIEQESFRVGDFSYLNGAHIVSASYAKVIIGNNCAIGYRVSIKSTTHLMDKYWPCENSPPKMGGKDIIIGDRVWIGDGVFIKSGVIIGNDVIIGANSVVTRDIPDGKIYAGIPAREIQNG